MAYTREGKKQRRGLGISIGNRHRPFVPDGKSESWWITAPRDGFTAMATPRYEDGAAIIRRYKGGVVES